MLSNQRLTLRINGITPPKNEDYIVRIFVNCNYLTKDTPTNDPHYLTSITFFGSHNHSKHSSAHSHKIDYLFDVTDEYQKIIGGDIKETERLNIQLLALPINGKGESILLEPEKIALSLTSKK